MLPVCVLTGVVMVHIIGKVLKNWQLLLNNVDYDVLHVINAVCGLYSSEILSLLDIVDYQFSPLIMPRCVGLPTGPCPNGRNDSYVRNGEGDLMLCPDCDSARYVNARTWNNTYTISSSLSSLWSDITNWDISRTPRRPQNNFTDIADRFAENR